MICAGKHLILELWGCKGEILDSESLIKEMLKKGVEVCGAKLKEIKTHKFNPQGLSAVALLNESYLSIHSWPEVGYAAVDIYTCAPHVDPERIVEIVKTYLRPQKMHMLNLSRGVTH
ncbi:MAG TPA: adenosylmethionine decarboxylase [Candidatus Desulfofervidus auxilii]|uniref:S-adenosylmethionine decarboxylase proenzyme n=1 Tax=Desulfofervidus auxilii TaxID=1621989 RepID=A0A7V0IA61_DESA2|nr:adenosylmethionine decarboxylase [Candidatus Desulfofervidus auxilii]